MKYTPIPALPSTPSTAVEALEHAETDAEVDQPGQRPRHRAGGGQSQRDALGRVDFAEGIEHQPSIAPLRIRPAVKSSMSRNPSLIPGVTLPAHSIRAKTTNVRPTTEPASDGPMPCRDGCGACCIAPSITSPIPGMPHGKPAGMPVRAARRRPALPAVRQTRAAGVLRLAAAVDGDVRPRSRRGAGDAADTGTRDSPMTL